MKQFTTRPETFQGQFILVNNREMIWQSSWNRYFYIG